ncbi:MAG: helix-hairpin-helix domain-containing protein [Pyrinomonadaceae bacterium]|nr:helix-hairpin-helix domain-containing protein [Pyrinomonadaceae bacterium]
MRLWTTSERKLALLLVFCATTVFNSSCVKTSPATLASDASIISATTENNSRNIQPLDINSASVSELEKLPGVGQTIARRIVEHRTRYGSFRRPEHLIIVRGISERRYKLMRPFITAG